MTEGRDPREMLADADDLRRAVAETRELGGHAASRRWYPFRPADWLER